MATPETPVPVTSPQAMSITITAPPNDGSVGTSFTVSGNWECDVSPSPTLSCTLDNGTEAATLTSQSATSPYTWEAYFSGIAAGTYTVTAEINHTGRNKGAEISVTVPHALAITIPKIGDSIPLGQYTVTGTGTTGDEASVSITENGKVVAGPVTAKVDQDGNWAADFNIPDDLDGGTDLAVTATLVSGDVETSIGELSVVYSAG